MNKYRKTIAYPKPKAKEALANFKQVIIMEKVDGANASLKLDVSFGVRDGKLECFSRNNKLTGEDGLRGFKKWVVGNIDVNNLYPNVIYYGEWLVSHKVKYTQDAYGKFYLFDLFFTLDNKYYSPLNEVGIQFVEKTEGALFAPVLYVGEMPSVIDSVGDFTLELIEPFMRTSHLGAEVPEGIVIKDYSYVNTWGESITVKLINEEFREVRVNKEQKAPRVLTVDEQELANTASSTINLVSVEKHMSKLVDEGLLNEDWKDHPLSNLIKLGVQGFKEDIMEEHFQESLLTKDLLTFVNKTIGGMFVHTLKELYFKE